MSVVEALRGAAVEVGDAPAEQRLAVAARLAVTVVRELGAGLILAPWGARAALARARTPPPPPRPPPPPAPAPPVVSVAKDVRYGPGPRQVADVWVAGGDGGRCPTPPSARPVALLIHGGVWSSGDKWTLGPAAAALAAASGAAVAVPNYSLWRADEPDGGIEGGLRDVRAAVAWAAAGGVAAAAGGTAGAEATPPSRLSLVGHSAGAHLAALAALSSGRGPAPDAVVGLAGAYDLSAHYEYERGRGVHYLSTMARAAAGALAWPGMDSGDGPCLAPTPREAAGLEAASPTAVLCGRVPPKWKALARPGLGLVSGTPPKKTAWLLLAGGADGTVPPSQSTAFADALRSAGAAVDVDVLPGVRHVDFVTGWGWGGGGGPAWTRRVAEVVAGGM